MTKATLILNGASPDIREEDRMSLTKSFIVCADGGYKHAQKLQLTPHMVVGDFDSLSKALQKELVSHPTIQVIRFPTDKEETDSEIAVKLLFERGYRDVAVIALQGTRLDHVFANILLLARYALQGMHIKIIDAHTHHYISSKKLIIKGVIGESVSLIPLMADIREISTTGLQYQLKGETLEFGKTRGISNILTDTKASIRFTSGVLMVTHAFDTPEEM